jgi:TPR repeat protein
MDVQAQYQFDLTYYNSENYVEALKAAGKGDAEAQNNLGWMYNDGKGVAKDKVEADKWFRKAAEQGHIDAQFWLGHMYSSILFSNGEEAVKWYRKAAEQGEILAQYYLGLMYYKGELIEEDIEEAVKWLRKASEQGDIDEYAGKARDVLKNLGRY